MWLSRKTGRRVGSTRQLGAQLLGVSVGAPPRATLACLQNHLLAVLASVLWPIIALPLMACCALLVGCAQGTLPRIDPSGERIFARDAHSDRPPAGYRYEPGGRLPWDDVAVTLSPQVSMAPVGKEVVLVAGVVGPEGYFMTNRRLEWSLAQGSVGQFVDVGGAGFGDMLLGDFNFPRKINSSRAVGSTSRRYIYMNRGTPDPSDDVVVKAGQGWATITSPVEGASYVTVFAPDVYPWDARTQSAVIYWVDAQWRFPPPAIAVMGTRHTLCTTVVRQSDQSPCPGWQVRYTVMDGPAAGFAPDGAASIDVVTDAAGQARAEIFQKQPASGINRICVQVIKSVGATTGDGRQLVIGSGMTTVTWTSAATVQPPTTTPTAPAMPTTPSAPGTPAIPGAAWLDVKTTGPSQVNLGAKVTFRITVTNRGTATARNLVIRDRFDPGLEHEQATGIIERSLGDLPAGQARIIEIAFRAVKPGKLCHIVEVTGDGGLRATDQACVTAVTAAIPGTTYPPTMPQPPSKTEPKTPAVPEPAKPVLQVTVSVRKIAPHGQAGARQERPDGLDRRRDAFSVGDWAAFYIEVTNTGTQTLSNVTVVAEHDSPLSPEMATEGNKRIGNSLTWLIASMPPGRTHVYESHCECKSVSARACLRVRAKATSGAQAEAEACVQIGPAAGPTIGPKLPGDVTAAAPLDLVISDLFDPITVKQTQTYVITVTNLGQLSDRNVTLAVTLPQQMILEKLGTTGPTPVQTVVGQTVRFAPAVELRPGKENRLEYRVRARATQPGKAIARAEVTSLNNPQPKSDEAETTILMSP